jgi:hypothetical protein
MLGGLDGACVRSDVWRRTVAACGCRDEAVLRFAAETHAGLARAAYRLFDDAPALLKSARDAGVKLVLVTNGASDTQREKLRVLELERWFELVVVSGEIGVVSGSGERRSGVAGRGARPRLRVHLSPAGTAPIGLSGGIAALSRPWTDRRSGA